MSTRFCRPGHLHTVSRILSCSQEAGLTAAPPTPTSTNTGTLRLRTSGKPLAELSINAKLLTGGNPEGYAGEDFGAGAGAALIWKNSADTSSQYRGYIDSIYLVRDEFPVTYVNEDRRCSTPRTLADGALGFAVSRSTGAGIGSCSFVRVTAHGTYSQVVITALGANSANRPDIIVLPSGRVLAFVIASLDQVESWYSDDHGATWTLLSAYAVSSVAGRRAVSVEQVDDLIILVAGDNTASVATHIYVSRDGGCSFSLVDSATNTANPRTCVTTGGTVLVVSTTNLFNIGVYPLAPGGGLPTSYDIAPANVHDSTYALCTRDDGTIWVFWWEHTAALNMEVRAACSLDGGQTWLDVGGGQAVLDCNYVAAVNSFYAPSAGMWGDEMIVLVTGHEDPGGAVANDNSIQMLTFGGWGNIAEKRYDVATSGQPYEHVYIPVTKPNKIGWTEGVLGAGANTSNSGPFNIVGTAANQTLWTAPAAVWNPVAGDRRRIRLRVRVNSGGSTTDNRSIFQADISDGVNTTRMRIRFSTTTARVMDVSGNVIVDIAVDLTKYVDFLCIIYHDNPPTKLAVTVWHRKDGEVLWTNDITNHQQAEIVGIANALSFGGAQVGAVDWDVAMIAIADDDDYLVDDFVNPGDLPGRPLSTVADYHVASGVSVGAYNGDAVPGDTYAVATTYNYGKENLWREFRPSRQVRSTATGAAWNVVLDASATDKFKGDLVALFGTNFRTATLQLNTADAWGAPAVSVALNATVASFVSSTVGPGFTGPAVSPNWRPGQFRSDTDAHRWFLEYGNGTYEIADNDEARIYIAGVDLTGSGGTTGYIFCDRMGAEFGFTQYRYARVLVGAQATADGVYRLGTVVLDKVFNPAQPYDHGFVERIEPNVLLFEDEAGYRMSARVGPRRSTLAIQWPPLDRLGPGSDVELRIADFFRAIEGSHRLIVVWRDTTDQSSLMLCRVVGKYSATNVWGEGTDAVTRIDQLVLEEEL